MIQKDDFEIIKRFVAETLNERITALINSRLDNMEDKLKKLDTIDRITNDFKSLFR